MTVPDPSRQLHSSITVEGFVLFAPTSIAYLLLLSLPTLIVDMYHSDSDVQPQLNHHCLAYGYFLEQIYWQQVIYSY